ncbi:uncharacterized protein LAESUDRAFT_757770 [Laetiporus sulphureus 93-53]|uniref:Uncharacterized protein n=1 Tax=Laetiporus sulphureus 93-53 TaxID=1314785 RepID=A0A165EZU9_9APHY|nr:uncharacterized protein LAESUDRAFT_757770 [Laetiporus sulphureus 93-53]KZT08072.1 hypothetical protein LAESUDRAFT_757770 [Laetiporus sulphureus 93-53]
MSALLQKYPNKQNSVSDDIESIVLVAEWMALKYHRHNLDKDELQNYVSNFYDWRVKKQGHDVGGGEKFKQWTTGQRSWSLKDEQSLFGRFLDSLLKLVKEHYDAFDTRELEQQEPDEQPQLEVEEYSIPRRSRAKLQQSRGKKDSQDAAIASSSNAHPLQDSHAAVLQDVTERAAAVNVAALSISNATASTSASTHETDGYPQLTLNTHTAIISLCEEFLDEIQDNAPQTIDKMKEDQFKAFSQSMQRQYRVLGSKSKRESEQARELNPEEQAGAQEPLQKRCLQLV